MWRTRKGLRSLINGITITLKIEPSLEPSSSTNLRFTWGWPSLIFNLLNAKGILGAFRQNTYASKMVGCRRSIWNFWYGPKIYSKRLCSHSRAFLGKCQTAEPLFCISNQQVDTFTTTATLLAKMSGISTFAETLMARALFLYLTSEVYRTNFNLQTAGV